MRKLDIEEIIQDAKKMSKKYTENELYEMLGKGVLEDNKKNKQETEQEILLQQTLMFWDLQLQFFQIKPSGLFRIMSVLKRSKLYVENKHSKKMEKILNKMLRDRYVSEEDKECLATHLAMQLAGVDG